MKRILILSFATIVLVIGIYASMGKIAPLSWQLWGKVNQHSGVGLHGYDVVSYHTAGNPEIGSEQLSSAWEGTTWHFSSAENKALFESGPDRYIPSYGGFCAYAVLNNFTADVDPTVWYIHNGKLYLFASDNPKNSWVAEISNDVIQTSDKNWAKR